MTAVLFFDELMKYSPDQPRDAKGRWTAGGSLGTDKLGGPGPKGQRRYWLYDADHKLLGTYNSLSGATRRGLAHTNKTNETVHLYDSVGHRETSTTAFEPGFNRPNEWSVNPKTGRRSWKSTAEEDRILMDMHKSFEPIKFEIKGRVGKTQPGVADVHAPTALGNQRPRAKAKDFLTVIGEVAGGAKIVQLPPPTRVSYEAEAEALSEVGKGDDGLVSVLFMRHGATRFNNQTDMSQDRVRSWNDVPLTQEGKDDATKAGEKLQKEGIGVIVSSSLGRARMTARLVKKAIGDKNIEVISTPKMLPWNLGKFTGQTTDEAHDGIKHYIENPDEEVPDGESFNDFRARAFAGMAWALKKAGRRKLLVISHHRNERLFATSGDPPRPDAKIDAEKFLKPGEDPGDVTTFEFDPKQLKGDVGTSTIGKVYDSNSDLPSNVTNVLPDDAQTVFRRVFNDSVKGGKSEDSARRIAWTAVKNGWRKEGDQWVRKFAGDAESLVLFTEQQIAKLKGEFPLSQGTDINASLHLNPLDAQNARSPFPYNQYFFANLRNDQKERMLAALTDQDSLPLKLVRLSDLSSVQDRIDPNKVQSMLDGEPEKPPVIVRTAPGRLNIADGHHRLTAQLLSGRKTAVVRYMDIEPEVQAVISDDNPGSEREEKRAKSFIGSLIGWFSKAGPEDEPRDEHGRWEAGGSNANAADHLAALKAAQHNQDQFNAAFERLSNDKSMKNEDIKHIARGYVPGGVILGKTRSDMLKEISQEFIRSARFENKIKRDDGFSRSFEVKKIDEDQQLVFGWASISSVGGEYVVDKQEDIIPEDELEKAAYDFVLYHRSQGDMHERMGVGRCVESMMFTKQKQDALGIDLGLVGWWVGFKVDDAGVWKRIKGGDLPEFSIGGKATREAA